MKSKELFPAVFSRHAAEYQRRLDDVMSRGEARGRLRAVELVDGRPGMRVLDLACGPGTLTRPLAQKVAPGGEVVGVDLAPGMIELARSAGIPNARFDVMDIEELDFATASFDAAACGHGIQFVPDLHRALSEAHRVLRPEGRFAASVPMGNASRSVWATLDEVVDRRLPPAPRAVDQDATRIAVGDPKRFAAAAANAGFTDVRVEVVEERVHWESADQLLALFTSWWDCAVRIEETSEENRRLFIEEARAALIRAYPGAIQTTGHSHVLFAVA